MSASLHAHRIALDARRVLGAVHAARRPVLDPLDRLSEATSGLLLALTVTGALSVAAAGRPDVRSLLVAALACNVAWGLVDGVAYLLTALAGRARAALALRGLRVAGDEDARAILGGALPEAVAAVLEPIEADRLVVRLRRQPLPPRHAQLTGRDLVDALGSGLLVLVATLPPTLPFLLLDDAATAQRISRAAAVACLFLAGYALGKKTGIRACVLGAAMVLVGGGLVALTAALGG